MSLLRTPVKVLAIAVAAVAFLPGSASAVQQCTMTPYYWYGTQMDAKLVDPGSVTGTLDASPCEIAVYYDSGSGSVSGADISGANFFGVLNNGADVTVSGSTIHDISEQPLAGGQHGFGVFFDAGSTGSITNNTITGYQKGGIVVHGPNASQVPITGNSVTGAGPTSILAQTGIEIGEGATTLVTGNTVDANSYTGGWARPATASSSTAETATRRH
jgi:hypothetical protein